MPQNNYELVLTNANIPPQTLWQFEFHHRRLSRKEGIASSVMSDLVDQSTVVAFLGYLRIP